MIFVAALYTKAKRTNMIKLRQGTILTACWKRIEWETHFWNTHTRTVLILIPQKTELEAKTNKLILHWGIESWESKIQGQRKVKQGRWEKKHRWYIPELATNFCLKTNFFAQLHGIYPETHVETPRSVNSQPEEDR